ncbi:MAG: hypothetical protein HPY83_00135 [Anaerolineae bacterium]|nr:hypothetical protein [Anaerolineae bacterium]
MTVLSLVRWWLAWRVAGDPAFFAGWAALTGAVGAALLASRSRLLIRLSVASAVGVAVVAAVFTVPSPPALLAQQPGTPNPILRRFGDGLYLVGYETERKGAGLILRLYWTGDGSETRDWTVFAHLLDGRSVVVGQHDGQPAGGLSPTSHWARWQVITDEHPIAPTVALTPGEYRLEVGFYRPETGERLPAYEGEKVLDQNRVLLPTVCLADGAGSLTCTSGGDGRGRPASRRAR